MNRKLATTIIQGSAISLLILILVIMTIPVYADVPNEPHSADAIWVEPSSVYFTPSNDSVGTKFNVTVWLNMTEKVFNYQVALYYNRTQLMCTRGGYTGVPGSQFATGHTTSAVGPQIDTSYLGNGSVLASETCLAPDFVAGPHSGSLIWMEFEIMIVPASGNVTSTFDLSTTTTSGDTWVSPDGGVTTYTVAPSDGNYTNVPEFSYIILPAFFAITLLAVALRKHAYRRNIKTTC
jgi:hypothetical protein